MACVVAVFRLSSQRLRFNQRRSLKETLSYFFFFLAADFGGGGEAQGDFPGARLPFHAQRDGGPVSSSRAHGHRQELPPRRWE